MTGSYLVYGLQNEIIYLVNFVVETILENNLAVLTTDYSECVEHFYHIERLHIYL